MDAPPAVPSRPDTPEDRSEAPYVEWPARSDATEADVRSHLRAYEAAFEQGDLNWALASIESVVHGRPAPQAEDLARRAEVYLEASWTRAALSDLLAAERAADSTQDPGQLMALFDPRAQVRIGLLDLEGGVSRTRRGCSISRRTRGRAPTGCTCAATYWP